MSQYSPQWSAVRPILSEIVHSAVLVELDIQGRHRYGVLPKDTLTLPIYKIWFGQHFKRYALIELDEPTVEVAPRSIPIPTQSVSFEAVMKAFDSNSPTCPVCGSRLILRSGKYGEFWGCPKYPACQGKRAVKPEVEDGDVQEEAGRDSDMFF